MRNCIYIIILLLAGCDCFPRTDSIVLDKTTNLPVDSAEIKVFLSTNIEHISADDTILTDQNGRIGFMAHTGFDGLGSCPTVGLEIRKTGYKLLTIDVAKLNDTFYLIKE